MDAKRADVDALFRVFTACPNDPHSLLLDVRPHKDFKRSHVSQAFNVRTSANGAVLLDYSQSSYSVKWSADCWWGKPVIVYGAAGLAKDHPVVAYLAKEGRCSSLQYLKDGYEAFEAAYPFLCTASVKATSLKKYPSQIVSGEWCLYLGDWGHAQDVERLDELRIRRVLTVHNHPENLQLPSKVRHARFTLADVETADIAAIFNGAYEFLEDARRSKQNALVHCGAGVSRSAALVMMYLMRSQHWGAQRARELVVERRSLVCVNDGFWRSLCALEGPLGIVDRSDPNATSGFAGADATAAVVTADAVGGKVGVEMVAAGAPPPPTAAATQPVKPARGDVDGAQLGRSEGQQRGGRSRSGSQGRRRSRSRDRRRSRSRERQRSRSRERRHSGSRGRRRSRSRERRRDGEHHGRSRSRGEGRERNGQGALAADRADRGGWGSGAAPAVVPPIAVPIAAAAAATPAQQKGWRLELEVSRPQGLVGVLRLGPMTLHQRVVFGRAPGSDVLLEHLSVSRAHAQLTLDASGGVQVMDLGSAHGTKLGEAWVKAQQPRPLALGGTLQFGASTRTYKLLRVERLG